MSHSQRTRAPESSPLGADYLAGRELCHSYVAGEPKRFRRLLTEQIRVRDLLKAPGESAGIEKAPLPGLFP